MVSAWIILNNERYVLYQLRHILCIFYSLHTLSNDEFCDIAVMSEVLTVKIYMLPLDFLSMLAEFAILIPVVS